MAGLNDLFLSKERFRVERIGEKIVRERYIQILNLAKLGKSSKEIAGELGIKEDTVKKHMQNIMGELGASNRAHAVYLALKGGIIDKEETLKE